jgi:hypothetical protein
MGALLGLLASILGLLGLGGGGGGSTPPAPPDPPPSAATPLTSGDRLGVARDGDRAVLRTADGRQAFLRGANVNALVDYGGAHGTVPVTDRDAEQARALGFTVVRLAVSWSRIVPQPGAVDAAYLDEVRRAAGRFADRGIHVLLDLHQDRYGAGLGPTRDERDGAPRWAQLTGGASTAGGSTDHDYYGSAAARAAARAFFDDATVPGTGRTLQAHYGDALVALADVGEDLGPALAGIELFNEPVDPVRASLQPSDVATFYRERLWPFYRRAIERLRTSGYDGPIWFEGSATRTHTDDDPSAARFSDDPGLVYGPHVYTDVYNGRNGSGTPARIAASFARTRDEADRYGAALAPTELPGAAGTIGGDWERDREATLDQLDALGAGGMVWVWKQHPSRDYGWGVLTASGGLRGGTEIAQDYGRARVRSSSAPIASVAWRGGTLRVRTTGAGVVELWDGAATGARPLERGASPTLTIDGTAAAAGAVEAATATSPLASAAAWIGGRVLRVTVGDGEHEVALARAGG